MSWLKRMTRGWLGIEKKTWTIVLDGRVSRELEFSCDKPDWYLYGLDIPDLDPANYIDEDSFFDPQVTVSRKVYVLVSFNDKTKVASYMSFNKPTAPKGKEELNEA